ncbi:unnamed protein product [Camellia sinensis]
MDPQGWNPVIRRRRGGHPSAESWEGALITIFIDNIPESMDPQGLFQLFRKFGLVKDVFIPGKRRKASNSRFGFVRYNCEVAARVAIQKADGLWCGNKALRVKRAEYQKPQAVGQQKNRELRRDDVGSVENRWAQKKLWKGKGAQKSYAEALLSDVGRGTDRVVIKASQEGNGWSSESLVVQLCSFLAFEAFSEEMRRRGMKDVVAREGGGKLVLLTFPTEHQKLEGKRELQGWGQKWCESINEWSKGQFLQQERCIWLYCFGIPLNLWSIATVRSIGGNWGKVVQYEEDFCDPRSFEQTRVRVITSCMEWINTTIYLSHNGSLIPVRVCEEFPNCLFPSSPESIGKVQGSLQSNGRREEDQSSGNGGTSKRVKGASVGRKGLESAGLEVASRVMETVMGSSEVQARINDEKLANAAGCSMGNDKEDAGTKVNGAGLEVSSHQVIMSGIQNCDVDLCSPGLLRELSGPAEARPSINLEVVIKGVQQGHEPSGLIQDLGPELSGVLAQPSGRTAEAQTKQNLKQFFKAQRSADGSFAREGTTQGKGKQWKKGMDRRKWVFGRLGFQKGAIFRASAEAATSQKSSSSQSQATKRRRQLHDEAMATMRVGTELGIDFRGKEEEVVSRIEELEEKDLSRIGGGEMANGV